MHSWKNLEKKDEADMHAKARLYRKAKRTLRRDSISLSSSSPRGEAASSPTSSLLQTFASAGQTLQSLQARFAYATAPPPAPPQYAAPAPPQQAAPLAPAQPAAVQPMPQAMANAPASNPSMLPGAVGNIPYVYDDKQYLPSPAPGQGYPIVWLFADNKTPDKLYFGYQSADGEMHVYNEIKPNGVTRQQAFGNEYWTILAADKRTVAVQPFKITQQNQWLSIGPSAAKPTL